MARGRPYEDRKIYACQHPGCDSVHSCKFNLEQHTRTHTGEKPYRCKHADCNSAFSRSWLLSRHCKNKHKDDNAAQDVDTPATESGYYPATPSGQSMSGFESDGETLYMEDTQAGEQESDVSKFDMSNWAEVLTITPQHDIDLFACSQCPHDMMFSANGLQVHLHVAHQEPRRLTCPCPMCLGTSTNEDTPNPANHVVGQDAETELLCMQNQSSFSFEEALASVSHDDGIHNNSEHFQINNQSSSALEEALAPVSHNDEHLIDPQLL